MDSKFYVSLEAARLLKEKWDNEKVDYMYDDGELALIKTLTNSQIDRYYRNMYGIEFYGAPTKAEAIDWLESNGIIIEVFSARIGEDRKWCYSIINAETNITIDTPYKCSTRLEAEEAAIIRALKLL